MCFGIKQKPWPKKQLKVVELLKLAFYHNLPSGGALRHLNEIIRSLKKEGHIVDLYTPSTADTQFLGITNIIDRHFVLPAKVWKAGFKLLNPLRYFLFLKDSFVLGRQFAGLIMKEGYDGVYFGQCQVWTEPPVLFYLSPQVKSVLYCAEPKRSFHEPDHLKKRNSWSFKKIWRLPLVHWMKRKQIQCIQKAHHVFCNSQFSQTVIGRVYPGIKAKVCYIGTNTKLFKPDSTVGKKNILLSVGALDETKNHQMAIEVAARQPAGQKFDVCIVTDRAYGETEKNLINRAANLKVHLEIHKRIPVEALVSWYQKCFAAVYCPVLEPFGLVSLEAQSCGTPVLGRDEGGLKESIVNGKSGFRLGENVQEYVDKLAEWIEYPDVYQKISQTARDHILQNWNEDKLMKETLRKLDSIFT